MQSDPNSALAALRDIHGSPDILWWPPAPGWWVLAVILLAGIVWAGIRLVRDLRRLALQRRVIRQLDTCLENYGNSGDLRSLASSVNLILKRVALRRFGRKEISALHGNAWAQFLAESARPSAGPSADAESWQQLAAAPYSELPSLDATASLELARGWVQQHV